MLLRMNTLICAVLDLRPPLLSLWPTMFECALGVRKNENINTQVLFVRRPRGMRIHDPPRHPSDFRGVAVGHRPRLSLPVARMLSPPA